jgi:hypothetical protein
LSCMSKDGETLASFLRLAGSAYADAETKIANAASP